MKDNRYLTPSITLVAFLLLAISIPQMELKPGFYGLIHSFPPTYFIGLVLLVLTFVVTLVYNPNRKLLGLQTLGLVTALWAIPTLIGSHPGLSMAYRNLQDVGNITTQGLGILYWWYLSWPGFQTLFSIVTGWGINLEGILTIYPFFIELTYAIPLYIFLRNTLGKDKEKYCWVGMWIFYLGNWTGQDYFGPQSLALLLLLAMLAIVTHNRLWEGPTKVKLTMTFILTVVFSYLVITHLLTSLVAICILSAYALVRKSPRLAITIGLCALLILSWDVTFGGHYTYSLYGEPYGKRLLQREGIQIIDNPEVIDDTPTVTEEKPETPKVPTKDGPTSEAKEVIKSPGILTFNPEYILQSNVLASLSGSDSHIAVVRTRIAYSSVFAIIGILGTILILIRKRTRTNITILAMALSLVVLLPLRYAGWELISRLYMFELPFIAYLGTILLTVNKRKVMIGLGLLFTTSSLLFLISHYGNHPVDHWSQDYKVGYKFTQELRTTPNCKFGSLLDVSWDNGDISFGERFPTTPHYLTISKYDDDYFTYVHNNPNFVDLVWEGLKEDPSYTSIYQNPGFEVFKKVLK